MPKKPNYCCIRCGYETDLKSNMYRHLFLKKTSCPQLKNLIELTDEIKQHIMDNRIYIIPKVEKPTKIINNITNNNKMINYIINMDTIEKLEKYTNYNQLEILDFDDTLNKKFNKRADKFITNYNYNNMTDDTTKLIEDVKEMSINTSINDFNIFYDSKIKINSQTFIVNFF